MRGLLTKRTVPGEASELLEYDEIGRLSRQGRDVDGSGVLDAAGTDEVTDFASSFANENGGWYAVETVSRYETPTATPTVISTHKSLLGGNPTTHGQDRVHRPLWKDSHHHDDGESLLGDGDGYDVASDSSLPAVRTSVNGRLVSETTTTVSQPTQYEYDGLGRLDKVTDPRGVIRDPVYTGAVVSSETVAGQQTGYTYYPQGQAGAGQLWTTTYADGKTEVRSYDLRGFLSGISGTGRLQDDADD